MTPIASRRMRAWAGVVALLENHVFPKGDPDGRYARVDLRSSGVALRARRAVCAEHGDVVAEDVGGRFQCWCGDSVLLKTEADRLAEAGLGASIGNDPTWRC